MAETRILLFLTPVALLVLLFVVRAALGRKPTRFTVNVALSLLLLVYFAGVAGTGIFWVATQELPVFDWHYLLGYITLLLIVVHIVINFRHVAAFLRRGAPARLKEASGRRFAGWVRGVGGLALAAALGTALFLAGGQYASRTIHVYVPEPAGETGLVGIETGILVDVDGERISMAEFYHRGSSYPARVALPGVTWRSRPAVYKAYPGRETVALPDVRPEGGGSVIAAADAWRRGCDRLLETTLPLADLSLLLFHTHGITKVKQFRTGSYAFRAAPSAGALYPVEAYVVANRVEGLAPGLYHHDIENHRLVLLRGGDVTAEVAEAAGSPAFYGPAAATVIFAVNFGRTGFKYKQRVYRYVNMDTGHAAYNLGAAAATLGLAAPMVARFDDTALNGLLGIDGETEAALLLMPIGKPVTVGGPAPGSEPRFVPKLAGAQGEAARTYAAAIHEASSLSMTSYEGAFPSPVAAGDPIPPEAVVLPEPEEGYDLFLAIRDRRSVREHSSAAMEQAELAALLRAAEGAPGGGDPLWGLGGPITLTVVVRDVTGLAPGVYRCQPATRTLSLVKAGDFGAACRSANLNQDFCGTADAVFVKSVAWKDLLAVDDSRGYRYACLRAGVVGEGLYLMATALGLGPCGVGAFNDAEVAEIAGLDPDEAAVLYVTAVGR